MEKIVPLLKTIKTMFYIKFLGPRKVLFGPVKVQISLKFEFKLFKSFYRV
jgi:hypothetical protein